MTGRKERRRKRAHVSAKMYSGWEGGREGLMDLMNVRAERGCGLDWIGLDELDWSVRGEETV